MFNCLVKEYIIGTCGWKECFNGNRHESEHDVAVAFGYSKVVGNRLVLETVCGNAGRENAIVQQS